jgi:hypothetical protein
MTTITNVLRTLIAATTLAIAFASPGHSWAADRAAAIHECSVRAGKFTQHGWGDTELYVYRACMAEHGQKE